MANARTTDDYYQYATVDSAPGAGGYFTNAVGIRQLKGVEAIHFSIRGSGQMNVTLQFRCPGDSGWTDYNAYNTSSIRKLITGGAAGVQWRAGVKLNDYTSGECIFGFDW